MMRLSGGISNLPDQYNSLAVPGQTYSAETSIEGLNHFIYYTAVRVE